MTNPKEIVSTKERRRSIALLVKPPLSQSPLGSNYNYQQDGSLRGSQNSSYIANTQFLREGNMTPFIRPGSAFDKSAENESAVMETSNSSFSDIVAPTHTPTPTPTPGPTLMSRSGISSGLDDPKVISKISKHLPSDFQSLDQEGADITRDLYKIQQDVNERPKLKKYKSCESVEIMASEPLKPRAGSFNVPGGFRREFLIHQHETQYHSHHHQQQQQKTKGVSNHNEPLPSPLLPYSASPSPPLSSSFPPAPSYPPKVMPNFLTSNFIEFLSIYGHFAGEELEDDDNIVNHYKYLLPGEETPLMSSADFNPKGTATDKKAYFLLLKAFVGTGVLFLPQAFANGGLLFSVITLVFFAVLSWWCYLILVYSKVTTKLSGFAEIGLKLYGPWLQRLILSSIVISQIGFVAAYIVFTAENLRAFIVNITNFKTSELNIAWFIIFQVILIIPMSLIRDITKLSISAVLANFFILTGLIIILYFIFYEWLVLNHGKFGMHVDLLFNQSDFSLFIGTAIFAFEGIGLIIPIQESMIHPRNFPKVLALVISTIALLFTIIGSLGYLTFGSKVKTVILLNLPQNSPMVILTQFLYSLAILLSTSLQLFPAIRLIESKLFHFRSGKLSLGVKWLKNLFRTSFVLTTAYVAFVGGRNLDKFVSFVGCFACIPLVYMYPPMLHLKSCCQITEDMSYIEKRKRYWLGKLDYLLVLIGGVAMIYTTLKIVNS
ncbi:AVT4 [Candida oxycetoniae]|uniref:AVT4 n=1 Tax=Candida oxycetoniae TaxID=497107 RepID=A0AAI9T2C7_9ASCO|nr:AVT4 [Candida oxycetoniae]KAI3407126.2 AVT4 [Candida oxycetoniae]